MADENQNEQPDPWAAALAEADFPEQFRNPESFTKSWREAQRSYTQAQQEIAALQEQLHDLSDQVNSRPAQQSQYDPSADPVVIAYERAMEEGDYRSALGLQLALQQQAMQNALQQVQPARQDTSQQEAMEAMLIEAEVAKQYGDEWGNLKDKIVDELDANPWLYPDEADVKTRIKALSHVAQNVKSRMLIEQSQLSNQQQQDTARQQKLLAQGLTGQGARGGAVDPKDALKARLEAVTSYGYGS